MKTFLSHESDPLHLQRPPHFSIIFCISLASTAFAVDLTPEINRRMEKKWLTKAQSFTAAQFTIYYIGTKKDAEAASDGWRGIVEGEVLVLTDSSAMACASFTLKRPGPRMEINGPHKTVLTDGRPQWKSLLKTEK